MPVSMKRVSIRVVRMSALRTAIVDYGPYRSREAARNVLKKKGWTNIQPTSPNHFKKTLGKVPLNAAIYVEKWLPPSQLP